MTENKSLLLIIFLILILNCFNSFKQQFKPYDIDKINDAEDNDNRRDANIVNASEPIIGFFNDKGKARDIDYYMVYFNNLYVSYKIIQTAVPGIDSKLTFFSADGRILYIIDNKLRGEAEKLWEYYPDNEYLLFKIESKLGYNEKVPYFIDFMPNVIEDNKEIEPNNKKENAVFIKVDQIFKGLISPREDIDFYKIVFDDSKYRDFSLEINTLAGIDINFTIINNIDNQMKYINNSSWGGREVFPFLSNEKGEYYIKVQANIKDYELKNPSYQFEIKSLPSREQDRELYYEREFNDTYETATELIDATEIQGLFFPDKDTDCYKFDLYKNAISVNIDLSSIRGLDPKIELYDNDFKLLKSENRNKKDEGEQVLINNMSRGRYYLKLESRESSLLVYKLFLKVRYK
ncbi:MAG: hypothetical protein JXB50_01420 [Spirochaetes bacterium]|nr:hypothetical protein [Spirochaetota bacterium]